MLKKWNSQNANRFAVQDKPKNANAIPKTVRRKILFQLSHFYCLFLISFSSATQFVFYIVFPLCGKWNFHLLSFPSMWHVIVFFHLVLNNSLRRLLSKESSLLSLCLIAFRCILFVNRRFNEDKLFRCARSATDWRNYFFVAEN